MKYASVIIPLVIVGVLFLLGCVWVATRGRADEGDEESVHEREEPIIATKHEIPPRSKIVRTNVALVAPLPIHHSPRRTDASSSTSGEDPPRYVR